jgi:hypothetical protein
MSQSSFTNSTQAWEAAAVLKIFSTNNDISCAGINQKGLPCGWRLESDAKFDARSLLREMSEVLPLEALENLPALARLCLCEKNHQNQAVRVIRDWTGKIEAYSAANQTPANSYVAVNSPGQPYHTSYPDIGHSKINGSSAPCSTTDGTRLQRVDLDDITQTLRVLDIDAEALDRVLRREFPEYGRNSSRGAISELDGPYLSPTRGAGSSYTVREDEVKSEVSRESPALKGTSRIFGFARRNK